MTRPLQRGCFDTSGAVLAAAEAAFVAAADAVLTHDDSNPPGDVFGLDAGLGTMESRYEDLKTALLAAGADARLPLTAMEQALRRRSALRRCAQQIHKSRRHFAERRNP